MKMYYLVEINGKILESMDTGKVMKFSTEKNARELSNVYEGAKILYVEEV